LSDASPPGGRPLRVVVLGGGLTGLSTAYHLGGEVPVLELEREAGGVARSIHDQGFVFDHTGHLLHFKDPRVARLLEDLVPGLFIPWDRRASIWRSGVRSEYPFQVNTHGHPPALVAECLTGFVEALLRNQDCRDGTFKEWILATFGEGFARHFFLPYNEKFWRRDLSEVTADWVSWAIPRPSLAAVVEGALGVVKRGLGYNPSFHYPRQGGIGQLADALAARVPGLATGQAVTGVDTARQRLRLAGGGEVPYEHLVSTVPLPALVAMSDLPEDVKREARELKWVGVLNFNVGLSRAGAWDDHWTYFPEPDLPFYRVGVPTNFSHGVAPPGTTSLYVEVTYRPEASPDEGEAWKEVLAGLERVGIVRGAGEIAVLKVVRIPCAYVLFDRHRQRALPGILAALAGRGITSVGRYGAWEYSSMEKALLDGMETAARLGAAP
jgi:protoporphyrinogen oxidase